MTKAFIDELENAEAVLCTLGKSIEAKDPYTDFDPKEDGHPCRGSW